MTGKCELLNSAVRRGILVLIHLHSIGAYPYNEATAYGEASMDTNKSTTQEGDTCTQAVLVVEITEMA